MKKMFVVLCVVMLASLVASAQLVSPTVYNVTYSGYCDGAHLVLQKLTSSGEGSSKTYVGGFHDLKDVCGFANNAAVIGQKHAINATTPPHFGVTGAVLDTGDADIDAQCICLSGVQAEIIYDLVHGFSGFYKNFIGFDGDYFCCDQTLVPGLPIKSGASASHPPAGGNFARKD